MKFFAVLQGILKKDLKKLISEGNLSKIKTTLRKALQIDKLLPGFKEASRAQVVAKNSIKQSEYAFPIYVLECVDDKGMTKGRYTYPKGTRTINCFTIENAHTLGYKIDSVLLSHIHKNYQNIDLKDFQNDIIPVRRNLSAVFDEAVDFKGEIFQPLFDTYKEKYTSCIVKIEAIEEEKEEKIKLKK